MWLGAKNGGSPVGACYESVTERLLDLRLLQVRVSCVRNCSVHTVDERRRCWEVANAAYTVNKDGDALSSVVGVRRALAASRKTS